MTNIGTRLASAPMVAIFTWIWTIGSVIASAFFAFSLFPAIYGVRSGAVVQIHFRTNEKYEDSNMETTYFPNTPTYRDQHLSQQTEYFCISLRAKRSRFLSVQFATHLETGASLIQRMSDART